MGPYMSQEFSKGSRTARLGTTARTPARTAIRTVGVAWQDLAAGFMSFMQARPRLNPVSDSVPRFSTDAVTGGIQS